MIIEVDPTELKPGDCVISLSDHEESGCHCDVRVTVSRIDPQFIGGMSEDEDRIRSQSDE